MMKFQVYFKSISSLFQVYFKSISSLFQVYFYKIPFRSLLIFVLSFFAINLPTVANDSWATFKQETKKTLETAYANIDETDSFFGHLGRGLATIKASAKDSMGLSSKDILEKEAKNQAYINELKSYKNTSKLTIWNEIMSARMETCMAGLTGFVYDTVLFPIDVWDSLVVFSETLCLEPGPAPPEFFKDSKPMLYKELLADYNKDTQKYNECTKNKQATNVSSADSEVKIKAFSKFLMNEIVWPKQGTMCGNVVNLAMLGMLVKALSKAFFSLGKAGAQKVAKIVNENTTKIRDKFNKISDGMKAKKSAKEIQISQNQAVDDTVSEIKKELDKSDKSKAGTGGAEDARLSSALQKDEELAKKAGQKSLTTEKEIEGIGWAVSEENGLLIKKSSFTNVGEVVAKNKALAAEIETAITKKDFALAMKLKGERGRIMTSQAFFEAAKEAKEIIIVRRPGFKSLKYYGDRKLNIFGKPPYVKTKTIKTGPFRGCIEATKDIATDPKILKEGKNKVVSMDLVVDGRTAIRRTVNEGGQSKTVEMFVEEVLESDVKVKVLGESNRPYVSDFDLFEVASKQKARGQASTKVAGGKKSLITEADDLTTNKINENYKRTCGDSNNCTDLSLHGADNYYKDASLNPYPLEAYCPAPCPFTKDKNTNVIINLYNQKDLESFYGTLVENKYYVNPNPKFNLRTKGANPLCKKGPEYVFGCKTPDSIILVPNSKTAAASPSAASNGGHDGIADSEYNNGYLSKTEGVSDSDD